MYITCLIYNYKYIKEIEEKNLIISQNEKLCFIHDYHKGKEEVLEKNRQHINKISILLGLFFLFWTDVKEKLKKL